MREGARRWHDMSVLLHIGTPTSPEDGAQAQGRDEGVRVQGRNASERACTCALCCTADGRAPRRAGGDGRTEGSARESVRRWHGWGALQYTGTPASLGVGVPMRPSGPCSAWSLGRATVSPRHGYMCSPSGSHVNPADEILSGFKDKDAPSGFTGPPGGFHGLGGKKGSGFTTVLRGFATDDTVGGFRPSHALGGFNEPPGGFNDNGPATNSYTIMPSGFGASETDGGLRARDALHVGGFTRPSGVSGADTRRADPSCHPAVS